MGSKETIEYFLDQYPVYRDLVSGYIPDNEALESIKANIRGLTIKVFFGDWCPDCRAQLPAFISIVLALDNDHIEIEFIGVNRSKEDRLGMVEEMNVRAVPTFIFLRDGKELGRVVERPTRSLEEDIAEIVG